MHIANDITFWRFLAASCRGEETVSSGVHTS